VLDFNYLRYETRELSVKLVAKLQLGAMGELGIAVNVVNECGRHYLVPML
jgi:hypothetical protein